MLLYCLMLVEIAAITFAFCVTFVSFVAFAFTESYKCFNS